MNILFVKRSFWYLFLSISLVLSAIHILENTIPVKGVLTFLIMMIASHLIVYSFVFVKDMRLGGFTLKANEQTFLRVFFLLFAVVLWLSGLSYISSY